MNTAEDIHYLSFGGGGVRGIAFAGAICELFSLLRYDVRYLRGTSGTSIGALYAAALAAGVTPQRLLEVARTTSLMDLVHPHITNLFTEWGFDTSDALEAWIDSHLGNRKMTFAQLYSETGRVLKLTATNLDTCTCYVLDHTSEPDMSIAHGVAMSMCLPPLFAPIRHKGALMVDGGILNNYPIDLFPAEHTLGFKVRWGHTSNLRGGFEKYFARLTYCTLSAAERRILDNLHETYRKHTIDIDCGDVSTINWRLPDSSVNAILERGRSVVREFVHKYNVRAVPLPLENHSSK